MAEPFKNLLGSTLVRELAQGLAAAHPGFPAKRFVAESLDGLDALELKARARHIADALERSLPEDRSEAFGILVRSLRAPLDETEGFGFLYFPYSEYLERHGPEAFDAALEACYALTQRFTSEFCIRALIEADAERTLATLRSWARDENPHVRRLVTEGTRPRLPWGRRLVGFQKEPRPVLELLELLRDDPSDYVRRSVANNLNDIAKDHPELVVATCARWLEGASKERKKLVEHALRSLVKAGHPGALRLFGADAKALDVRAEVSPRRVTLGDSVTIAATVTNRSRTKAHVVVDARVHFVKKRGPSAKVFKLGRTDLAPGASTTIAKSFPMVNRTIRELHGGRHAVEVQVNGRLLDAGAFMLVVPKG